MTVMTTRVKREFLKNENFKNDMFNAFNELLKLQVYYQAELKQQKLELKRVEAGSEEWHKRMGSITAYSDHVTELEYIIEMMRGYHNDLREG